MWPDHISNPGPLTYMSGVLPTALCGLANRPKNLHLVLSWKEWYQGVVGRAPDHKKG